MTLIRNNKIYLYLFLVFFGTLFTMVFPLVGSLNTEELPSMLRGPLWVFVLATSLFGALLIFAGSWRIANHNDRFLISLITVALGVAEFMAITAYATSDGTVPNWAEGPSIIVAICMAISGILAVLAGVFTMGSNDNAPQQTTEATPPEPEAEKIINV